MNPPFCFMSNLLFSFVAPLGRNEKYRDRCPHYVSKIPVWKKKKKQVITRQVGVRAQGLCAETHTFSQRLDHSWRVPRRGASHGARRPPAVISRSPLCFSSTWNMEQRWIIHNTCSFDMPNIRALCSGGAGASAAAHLPPPTPPWCDKAVTPHLRGPRWIILPECIIDTFNLSRHSAVWPLAAGGGGAWQAGAHHSARSLICPCLVTLYRDERVSRKGGVGRIYYWFTVGRNVTLHYNCTRETDGHMISQVHSDGLRATNGFDTEVMWQEAEFQYRSNNL